MAWSPHIVNTLADKCRHTAISYIERTQETRNTWPLSNNLENSLSKPVHSCPLQRWRGRRKKKHRHRHCVYFWRIYWTAASTRGQTHTHIFRLCERWVEAHAKHSRGALFSSSSSCCPMNGQNATEREANFHLLWIGITGCLHYFIRHRTYSR